MLQIRQCSMFFLDPKYGDWECGQDNFIFALNSVAVVALQTLSVKLRLSFRLQNRAHRFAINGV